MDLPPKRQAQCRLWVGLPPRRQIVHSYTQFASADVDPLICDTALPPNAKWLSPKRHMQCISEADVPPWRQFGPAIWAIRLPGGKSNPIILYGQLRTHLLYCILELPSLPQMQGLFWLDLPPRRHIGPIMWAICLLGGGSTSRMDNLPTCRRTSFVGPLLCHHCCRCVVHYSVFDNIFMS